LLDELNVEEPPYCTMCGFNIRKVSAWMEQQTKYAVLGYYKVHMFTEKVHYKAKIRMWTSMSTRWIIKLLSLKNSVKY
jgi:hypothetical protein